MQAINNALKDKALPEERLIKIFDSFWPELEFSLTNILNTPSMDMLDDPIQDLGRPRTSEDMMQELLKTSRMHTEMISALHSIVTDLKIEIDKRPPLLLYQGLPDMQASLGKFTEAAAALGKEFATQSNKRGSESNDTE
jgi:hypothetical protein